MEVDLKDRECDTRQHKPSQNPTVRIMASNIFNVLMKEWHGSETMVPSPPPSSSIVTNIDDVVEIEKNIGGESVDRPSADESRNYDSKSGRMMLRTLMKRTMR